MTSRRLEARAAPRYRSGPVTTFEVFKLAERTETIAAAIYAAVARLFEDEPEAHSLFVRLEREEQQHATRVRLLASRYRGDTRILDRPAGVEELDACLAEAEAALADVEAGRWGRDLGDVKRRLARLEARLCRAHAQALAKDGHPALRDFFRQLALQDEAHAALLGAT